MAPYTATQGCNLVHFADTTWPSWNQAITSTTASCTWKLWNIRNAITSTTVTPTSSVTSLAATLTATQVDVWPVWQRLDQLSQDMREAERRLVQRLDNTPYVVAEGERAKARERAEKLLFENLTPRQAEELRAKGYFTVMGPPRREGQYQYRVRRGRSGNVTRHDQAGTPIERLCIHPVENVPDADTMLAQKLMIENEEELFLRIANHSRP